MITVIGSLNYDLVTYTDKVPLGGETIAANSFEKHLGGKGLNEALACARLKSSESINVRMVGNVGSDTFGNELKLVLTDASVNTEFVAELEGESSGVAVILVEESGENRIMIIAGANGHLKPTLDDYERIFPTTNTTTNKEFVVLQNEYPHTFQSIDWLKSNRKSINVAYNPSPFKSELISEESLKKIDLLIVNEGEALDIAKKIETNSEPGSQSNEFFASLASKLQTFICQDNVSSVIITLGSQGAVYCDSLSKEVKFEPAATVKHVVDTTGAGDTFFGGVVLQLSAGNTLEEAIKFATVASSLTIQNRGAAESIPIYKDVIKALRLNDEK